MLWLQFLGLWIFSMIVYTVSRYYVVDIGEDITRKMETLIASSEIEVKELNPRQIEALLLIDMMVKTFSISLLCLIIYILLTA